MAHASAPSTHSSATAAKEKSLSAVEIPVLKKRKRKEEEKEEGGAIGLPFGLGPGGGAFSRLAAVGLRGGLASRSLLFSISEFFSTGAGIVTILGTIGAMSALSRWDLNRQREAAFAEEGMKAFMEESANAKNAAHALRNDGIASPSLPGGSESLNYLARANGGALANGDDAAVSESDSAASGAFDGTPAAGDAVDAAASQEGAQYRTRVHPAFGKAFGELTAAAGQTKWNGIGMSGGVLKQFDKPSMKLKAPPAAVNLGSTAIKNNHPTVSGGGRSYGSINKRVSGAFSQLRATNNLSRSGASAPSGELGHGYASAAFEGSSILGAAGGAIGGSGAGAGSPNGLDGGNPVTFSNSSQPINPAPVGNSENETPWQQQVNNAISLMAVGAVLILVASFLNKLMLLPFRILAMICAGIAAACGAAAAGIGVSLIAHWHQTLQGTIFTAGGGLITAAAAIVMAGGDKSSIKGDLTGKAESLTAAMMPSGAGAIGGIQTPP